MLVDIIYSLSYESKIYLFNKTENVKILTLNNYRVDRLNIYKLMEREKKIPSQIKDKPHVNEESKMHAVKITSI